MWMPCPVLVTGARRDDSRLTDVAEVMGRQSSDLGICSCLAGRTFEVFGAALIVVVYCVGVCVPCLCVCACRCWLCIVSVFAFCVLVWCVCLLCSVHVLIVCL